MVREEECVRSTEKEPRGMRIWHCRERFTRVKDHTGVLVPAVTESANRPRISQPLPSTIQERRKPDIPSTAVVDRACTLGPRESAETEVVADAGARTVPSSLPEMVVMPAVDFASSVSHSELFGALCVCAFANHEL